MRAGTSRWWRGAAVAVVLGGAAVCSGWLGVPEQARAQQPQDPPTKAASVRAKDDPAPMWTRSSAPPAVTAPGSVPSPPGAVIPISATIPVLTAPQGGVVPTPQPPPVIPPTAPTTPALVAEIVPVFRAVPQPAPPATNDQTAPTTPPPTLLGNPTPLPAPPSAAGPGSPGLAVPPPSDLARPAPSLNSASPVNPVLPIEQDFRLRPGSAGNSVKSDAPAPIGPIPTPPVVAQTVPRAPDTSVPAVPVVGNPGTLWTAQPPDRSKPTETAFGPTDKYVFPLPVVPRAVMGAIPGGLAEPAPPAMPVGSGLTRPGNLDPNSHSTDTIARPPGDDSMTPKQTAFAAVIGGVLALAPASPVSATSLRMKPTADAKDKKTVEERLSEIEKRLAALIEALDGKKDDRGFTVPSDRGLISEVKELKDEVARLKERITAMQNSTSLRPAATGPVDPMAGKGTIRVINDYPVEISILINEKSYRVGANTELKVTVPAGEFSYFLHSSGAAPAPTRSSIKEKEIVTLRIK